MMNNVMQRPDSYKNLYGFSEILFEYNPQGLYLGVCAIDPETLLEATIIAPQTIELQQAKRMAARKLRMVVDKKFGKKAKTANKSHNTEISHYGKREDTSGWNL